MIEEPGHMCWLGGTKGEWSVQLVTEKFGSACWGKESRENGQPKW